MAQSLLKGTVGTYKPVSTVFSRVSTKQLVSAYRARQVQRFRLMRFADRTPPSCPGCGADRLFPVCEYCGRDNQTHLEACIGLMSTKEAAQIAHAIAGGQRPETVF